MIVASPRPVAAVSAFAPLLGLCADELQLQMAQMRMGMGSPVEAQSEEYQNGVSSNSGDRPPKYTRYSTSYAFTHAAQPSTSSTSSMSSSSTSTARPSFDSFDAPSEHEPSQLQPQQKEQMANGSAAPPALPSEELGSAPPYDSSFADTNLSGLPHEALSALSLSRENLADLERANFDELDDLDRSDDRADPDAIVKRRLTHNALLARQSAITLASSLYSDGTQQPRESVYTTYEYDPMRASVQTYGSSVLTYGSRASQLLDGEDVSVGTGDGSRPVAPLPWLPRPSALDRIQHSTPHTNVNGGRARSGSTDSSSGTGTGRRPLPPLPTPTSATASSGPSPTLSGMRDRAVSLPSRSTSSGSNYSVSSASSAGRRPRPLPRTPTSAISPNLPDILEGEATESIAPSSGPVRTNSMFLSPTSAAAPSTLLGPGMKGRRSASVRYSTIGYGHMSRAGVRGAFLRSGESENDEMSEDTGRNTGEAPLQTQKQVQMDGRAASRASMRSARSTYLVPDVDELVRILDSMDDGSGSSTESLPATPLAGPWEPRCATGKQDDGEEEIDIGAVLARSRSVVNVPNGEKRGAAAALEDFGKSIGLPTPAATPRSSPQRQPSALPSKSNTQTTPSTAPQLQVESIESEPQSPPPTSADALSLTSFPLPPMAPLYIPAPSALGAADMPIPSAASGVAPSPSLVDIGKSFAERATLPGMTAEDIEQSSQSQATHPRHISTREAIADLKNRVSELPVFSFPVKKGAAKKFRSGVPLLGLPIPPRRRAQSNATGTTPPTTTAKKHPPAIDVRAANALPPPSSYNIGRAAGSISAPANGLVFNQEEKPTIIYSTPAPAPSVAPLRIRRGSSQTQSSIQADAMKVQVPPPANVSQSASAVQTTFVSTSQPPSAGRMQRATSLCVSPSTSAPSVAPLRFRSNKLGSRVRSSTIGSVAPALPKEQEQVESDAAPALMARKSSETDVSEESENEQLTTPTNCMATNTPIANVVEPSSEEGCGTGLSVLSIGSSLNAIQQANGGASIDPAFADIIKSIAGASEEEQMGSLLTIASSINTEHHVSGYNAGFCVPFVDADRDDEDGFVDIDEDEDEGGAGRKETVRESMTSVASTNERRWSKGRNLSSMKRRQSTRSAAAVRAAIRALPDPSTFPIPESAGSVATDSSALAAGADYSGFVQPSPLPKLKVVTKFKGGSVLLPATSAPLSAASTKSSMSALGGHSRNASGVSVGAKRVSTVAGPRKMNRLTLTDPRSPMGDAAVAAATLVARVRQKRVALASRGRVTGAGGGGVQGQRHSVQRGHARTGSGSSGTGTLRSKLKMSGSGFFGGSSVRALPDPGPDTDVVLRNGPRARRPTIRRVRMARTSVALSHNGEVDLCA